MPSQTNLPISYPFHLTSSNLLSYYFFSISCCLSLRGVTFLDLSALQVVHGINNEARTAPPHFQGITRPLVAVSFPYPAQHYAYLSLLTFDVMNLCLTPYHANTQILWYRIANKLSELFHSEALWSEALVDSTSAPLLQRPSFFLTRIPALY